MQGFKISLITVAYNAEKTLNRCIESVIAQSYNKVEYIIIDGKSTDNTLTIINKHKQNINVFISEPDNGIYDAMNKGIEFATGDIVGVLNADDFFADNEVLSRIATAFTEHDTDIVYGNLDYINPRGGIIRSWYSGDYKSGLFNRGWMPPHPTFYCKKSLFERFGTYDLKFGTAADYELMLRFMHRNKCSAYYVNKTLVKMNTGGISNRTYVNRLNAWRFDFKAMRKNGVKFPLLCVIFKPLRKIFQYI